MKDKKVHTNVRMSEKLKAQLEKEAKSQMRSFTNYLELLITTHQDRNGTR